MTEWLINTFIKDRERTEDPAVRYAYGKLAGLTGIFCNLLLAGVKLAAGILSASAAVISDAVNNLTDCISCIITMIGNRIAARPADEDHPFGHGRMEYIVALIITAIIFAAAFELLKEGISRILHPVPLQIDAWMYVILILTVLVKFWMSRFNQTLGERLNHTGLLASAKDSLNDMLATGGTIVSLLLSGLLPKVPIDGITASLVALYIFYSGWEMASEITGKLLGDNADEELQKTIIARLEADPEIHGVHDLIIHDYGPGNQMGSAHAELRPDLTLLEAHAIIDRCEEEIRRSCGVTLTIHPDPMDTDHESETWKQTVQTILQELNPAITIHDFRLREENGTPVLQFDAAVPYDCPLSNEELQKEVTAQLQKRKEGIHCRITFDRGHVSEHYE